MNDSTLQDAFGALKNIDSVFLAFNSNIDNIKYVNSKLQRFTGKPAPRLPEELKKPSDIFSGILHAMKYGESAELIMSKSVEKWLSDNMKPDKQRMGGQAGIMANLLAKLELQAILYAPLLSREQCKLFSKNVLLMDKGLKHPGNIRRNDTKKINWIFEFQKGRQLFGIRAKQSNRFIAASRPEKFRLKKIKLDFGFSCALLSGFQCIIERYQDGQTYNDQFTIAKDMINAIKAMNKPVHIEMAFAENDKILAKVLEISSMADSIGLDESELARILEFYGENELARRIHLRHDIIDVFLGMKVLSEKIKTKKIHMHGRGYFLATARGYHIRPEDIKKSMEFASAVAAAEATKGIKSRSDVKAGLDVPVSETGRKNEQKLGEYLKKEKIIFRNGIARHGNKEFVYVPTRLAHSVRDVVGLGDMISASIFTVETGFSLSPQGMQ